MGPSNPRVELVVESKRRRRRLPRPSHPGWISLWSPKGEDDSFSNHCEENQGLSLFLITCIGKFGRSQAVGAEQCGTELGAHSDGGEPEAGVTLGRGGPNRRQ